jgi:hypothetical protein
MIKKILVLLAIGLSGVFTAGSYGETTGKKEPVFLLSFNGTKDASGTLTVEKVNVHGEVSFTEGIKGKGLLIGEGFVKYRLPENSLNFPDGTISMWIKPSDWDTESYLDFFKGYENNKIIFRIYRFPHHYRGLQAYKYNDYAVFMRRAALDAWEKKYGKWHLVVFTWEGEKRTLYIDGLYVGTASKKENTIETINVLTIGNVTVRYVPPDNKAEQTYKTTVIDEVAIYDYAFTPEKVKKTYEKFAGTMEDSDVF